MVNASDLIHICLPDRVVGRDSNDVADIGSGDNGCALCHMFRSESILRQGAGQQDSKASSQTSEAAYMVEWNRYSFETVGKELAFVTSIT